MEDNNMDTCKMVDIDKDSMEDTNSDTALYTPIVLVHTVYYLLVLVPVFSFLNAFFPF
jgi:hypothetical protein